jgi:CheY-like chemotaxis protein
MGAKVLVVEDDAAMRHMLGSVLNISDLEPVLLTSAEEALEWLPDEQPDVILCDLDLPGMNGDAFIEVVRSSDLAATPIILMSAYQEPKVHRADAFFAKPFDPFEVADLVQEMSRLGRAPALR